MHNSCLKIVNSIIHFGCGLIQNLTELYSVEETQGMMPKWQEPICFGAELTELKNTRTMLSRSLVTTAWDILRLQMEKASRYGG
jgi:hypothetical protein